MVIYGEILEIFICVIYNGGISAEVLNGDVWYLDVKYRHILGYEKLWTAMGKKI